jgi:hypothetical protein
VIELREGLLWDADRWHLVFDGIRISPELIEEAWVRRPAELLIRSEDGEIRHVSSVRDGDVIRFTVTERPGPELLERFGL